MVFTKWKRFRYYTEEEVKEILNEIEKIVPSLGNDFTFIRLKDMDDLTKISLLEKHILSPEFSMEEENEYAFILNKEENVAIMLNEEDHIRIQTFSSGFDLEYVLNLAREIEEKMETFLTFAYDKKYGYLTACPTNVGTGLRASVMVHLPGLHMTGNINKVLNAIHNLGMNIRGVYGEGTQSQGHLYQISNHQSIGLTEEEILNNVKVVTEKVIEQERLARKHLGKNQIELADEIYRSYGILSFAKKISSEECRDLISKVKLGTDMGILTQIKDSQIKKMELYTKPGNLQKYVGKKLNSYERDFKRAEVIQAIMKEEF